MTEKTFLFQINVTRDCNLRCTHCYISTDKKDHSGQMSAIEFLATINQICEFSKTPMGKLYSDFEIHVVGGEPTMLGLDFYKQVLPPSRTLLGDIKQEVRFSIVTNLLTEKAVEIVEMFGRASTSYEPTSRFLSFAGRPKPALHRLWEANVKKTIEAGAELHSTVSITRGVVDEGAARTIEYLRSLNLKSVHLGFFIPSGDGKINAESNFPAFEETAAFLIDAFEWRLNNSDDNFYINPIESLIRSISLKSPIDDIICPIIPGSIDIDSDGETTSCIEAGGEVDFDSLGNVFEAGLVKILSSRELRKVRAKAMSRPAECAGCKEVVYCQYACRVLHDSWDKQGECPGFKSFIRHVRTAVENGRATPIEISNKVTGC